jgi:two-component system, NarL family, response regulator DesR
MQKWLNRRTKVKAKAMSDKSISYLPRNHESRPFVGRDGDPASRDGELDLLLVDDQLAARYSVGTLLRLQRDLREIATAHGSVDALTLAQRHRPRVSLISAALGPGEALSLVCRMKRLIHPPRVLILADVIDAQLVGAAIIAGADGVLWRYADPEELAGVIRRAATGEQHFPALRRDGVLTLLDRVEDRDRATLAMLLDGVPPDDVARTLGISARALDLRRKIILKSLGTPARATTLAGTMSFSNRIEFGAHSRSAPLRLGRRVIAGSVLGTPGSDGV